MSVTTKAIHAVIRGVGKFQNSLFDHKDYGYIPSRYAGFCNVLDNVSRMKPGERLRMIRPEASSTSMARAEQKIVSVDRLAVTGSAVTASHLKY